MITINNVTFRNLFEQVQKNKEDIARHYAIDRALANLGITVVGQVTTASQLPDPLTYDGEYGYAFAVGSKIFVDQGRASYEYYVYTRPDPNAGQFDNYWLNVGKISIVGPQGVAGPEGPVGPAGESTKWFSGANEPDTADLDDFWLNTSNGNVYKYNGTNWVLQINIKGPQGVQGVRGLQGEPGPVGPQGPAGERGDVGGFINIRGILPSTSNLPLPSQLNNLTVAYLIGAAQPYDLYIQVGENSDTATWNNAGPFNAATLVMVNGEAQNVWNADTKLDKAPIGTVNKAYISQATTGETLMVGVARYSPTDSYLVQYDATSLGWNKDDGTLGAGRQGAVKTGIPEKPSHAVPKQYFEEELAKKLDKVTTTHTSKARAYIVNPNGTQAVEELSTSPSGNAIPRYDGGGRLSTITPTSANHCATKDYVDTAVANAGGGGGGGLTVWKHVYKADLYDSDGNLFGDLIVQFLSYKSTNQVLASNGEGYIDMDGKGLSIISAPVYFYEGTWTYCNTGYASGGPAYEFTFDSSFEIRNEDESITIYNPNEN